MIEASSTGRGACAPLFASEARRYAECGLVPVPMGGDDGKRPLVRNWRRCGLKAWEKLAEQFPDANIGVKDGTRGGITRVDIDDADLIDEAIERFGDTPIKAGTPSGGLHLWYRWQGERRLTRLEGLPIDILGTGGLGVAPPSVKPDGGRYAFLEGSLADLERLPRIRTGSLPETVYRRAASNENDTDEGTRNDRLFKALLRQARGAETEEDLIQWALVRNEGFKPPLPESEVLETVRSAWRKQVAGENWTGSEARAVVRASEGKLSDDALCFLVRLRLDQGWREGKPFVLANAYTQRVGWSLRRFRAAKTELIRADLLEVVHSGGRGPNDPPFMRLK